MKELDSDLLQAYRDAIYRVDGKFDFKIDEYSAELENLHQSRGATHSHFITAFNPASQRRPAEENAWRHQELGTKLDELSCERLPAAGLDPEGHWPPEPGYLVFNLDAETALQLGAAYGQNAVVAIGRDAVPRLALISRP